MNELYVIERRDAFREFSVISKKEYMNTDVKNLEYQEVRFTGLNEYCNISIKHVKYNNGKRILNSNLVFPVYVNYMLSIANFTIANIRKYRDFNKLECGLVQLEKDKDNEYKLSNIGTMGVERDRTSYYLCLNITGVGLFKFSLDSNLSVVIENEQYINDTLHDQNKAAAEQYFGLLEDCLLNHVDYLYTASSRDTNILKNISSIDLLFKKYVKDEEAAKANKVDKPDAAKQ